MGAMVAVVYCCCGLGGIGAEGGPMGAGEVGYDWRVSGRDSTGVAGAGAGAGAGEWAELPFAYGVLYC